jgi:hypothetical protein
VIKSKREKKTGQGGVFGYFFSFPAAAENEHVVGGAGADARGGLSGAKNETF